MIISLTYPVEYPVPEGGRVGPHSGGDEIGSNVEACLNSNKFESAFLDVMQYFYGNRRVLPFSSSSALDTSKFAALTKSLARRKSSARSGSPPRV